MAYRSRLDVLYLITIVLQVIGMILNDFVPLYPASLWQSPSAPLHFLVQFRHFYQNLTGDPYLQIPSGIPWFESATIFELLTQFPLALYLIPKLFSKRPVDGPAEVAGLAFACLNTMGSAITTFDVWHMAPQKFGAGQQMNLVFGVFGPYIVISAIMAVDMYLRLLRRIQEPGKAKSH